MLTHSSCPLCSGPALRRQLAGGEDYHKITCPRCGAFVVEPTLPSQPWAQLPLEDMRLIVFLPSYIRHQNQSQHEPLLTLENWRTFARHGRLLAWERPEVSSAAYRSHHHN